jgi:uncharacterized protein (DUF2141 family)
MRAHAAVISIVALAACGTPKGTPQPHVARVAVMGGAASDQLDVAVSGLRSDAGTIRCYLYDDGDRFPDAKEHVVGKAIALPSGGRATCELVGVRRDHDFAVVILHDENNDNVFQKNFLGIPEEGYGFSNNAAPGLSAPSFGACRFHYAGGRQTIAITARY